MPPAYSEPVRRTSGWGGFRYQLHIGHHARAECLLRPLTWCAGIGMGQRDRMCRECPIRKREAGR